MADGYGIGMSARPTDFVSGGLSFFNSAIQARKQEIKDHVVEATKNEETMIKAMDMQRLGEVAGKARDGLDKDIQGFRTELVDRYRKSQGRLSSGDRVWMESKSAEIQNNIDWTKNQLEALGKAKSLVTQDKWNSYDDITALGKELVQAEDKIAARDKNVNPMNIVMSHFRVPTPEEILAKRVKDMGLKFDTAPVKTDNGDGTYTVTNKLTPAGLEAAQSALNGDPILNNVFTSRDKNGQPYVDLERRDTALQNMFGETGTVRYKPRARGAGAESKNLTTESATIGGEKVNDLIFVKTASPYMNVGPGSIDLSTGKPMSAGTVEYGYNMRVSVDPKSPAIYVEVPGGAVKKKDGKDLYQISKTQSLTADEIKSRAQQIADDRANYGKGKPQPAKVETTPDGDIKITPVVIPNTGLFGGAIVPNAPEDLDPIILKKDFDKNSKRTIKTPLTRDNYGPYVDKLGISTINGVPAKKVFADIFSAQSSRSTSSAVKSTGSSGFKLPGIK